MREELLEKQIQDQILTYLNYQGYICWRNNVGSVSYEYKGKKRMVRYGRPGMSDIIGFKKGTGRFIAIEVKRPSTKNNVSLMQQDFIDLVNMYGGKAIVATSLEDVQKELGRG